VALACGTALPAALAGGSMGGDPVPVVLALVAGGDGAGEPAPHPASSVSVTSRAAVMSAASSGARRDNLMPSPATSRSASECSRDYCMKR